MSFCRRVRWRLLLLALPAAFLGVFFLWPLGNILWLGVTGEHASRFLPERSLWEILTDPVTRSVVWFSLWQAAASTLLTLVLGIPGAMMFARASLRGRSALRAAITIPFVLPTVVVGAAFLACYRVAGVSLDTPMSQVTAILLAHVFFNYAVVVRIVGSVWSNLDPVYTEAAGVLGASRLKQFWHVTLPQLRVAVLASAVLIFLFTFTSFGVVKILGGPQYSTLEVEIYRQTAQLLDLRTAAVLSSVQIVAVVALLMVHAMLTKRTPSVSLTAAQHVQRRTQVGSRWPRRILFAGNIAVMGVLLGIPLLALVWRSVYGENGWTLAFYRELFSVEADSTLLVPAWESVGNSLMYALAAMGVALLLGAAVSIATVMRPDKVTRALDAALMLPLGVSAVSVGFGFVVALDEPPLDLRESPLLVPLAQALIATPFVVRTLTPVLRSIDERLRDAARVLGASPWRVWLHVDAPILARAGAVAAGFAFVISMGEFGATVFLARADTPTVPVAISQFLSRAGEINYGQAMALSVILMVVCAAALMLVENERFSRFVRGGEM